MVLVLVKLNKEHIVGNTARPFKHIPRQLCRALWVFPLLHSPPLLLIHSLCEGEIGYTRNSNSTRAALPTQNMTPFFVNDSPLGLSIKTLRPLRSRIALRGWADHANLP